MQQIQELIPIEYLIIAAAVLAVLFIVVLVFRALAGSGSGPESSRLAIAESLELDKNHRLVLVRRDNVEHLVLIGAGHDLLVESTIRPGGQRHDDAPASARILPGDRLEPEPDHGAMARTHGVTRALPLRAARPAVFGDSPPAPKPAERAEPRLEPLKPEESSREA